MSTEETTYHYNHISNSTRIDVGDDLEYVVFWGRYGANYMGASVWMRTGFLWSNVRKDGWARV